jgi:hypothetical protein
MTVLLEVFGVRCGPFSAAEKLILIACFDEFRVGGGCKKPKF